MKDLMELGQVARRAMEPGLPSGSDGGVRSAGSCLHAALVVTMLCKRFWGYNVAVRGGHEGARDSEGHWRGHYWVEIEVPAQGVFVVDITADQFGYEPVVVMKKELAQDRYRPGPQREVDEAFAELAQDFGCSHLIPIGGAGWISDGNSPI